MIIGLFIKLCATLVILLSFMYLYFKLIIFKYWKKRGVLCEEPTFPIGNVGDIIFKKQPPGNLFIDWYNRHKFNSVLGVYVFFKPGMLILDPDLIHFILINEFSSFHDRGIYCNEKLDAFLGGLFTLPGKKWRDMRLRLLTTMTPASLKQMFDVMKESGVSLNKYLINKVEENAEIDTYVLFKRYFLDNIVSMVFGIKSNCLENLSAEFYYWGKQAIRSNALFNFVFTCAPELLYLFSVPVIQPKVREFFTNIFEEMVNHREKNNIVRHDLLNSIMQLMKKGYATVEGKKHWVNESQKNVDKLTFSEAIAQVFTFFLGGWETTASLATFCLYELSLNQDIQRKVCDEIDTFWKKDDTSTYDSLNRMSYLDMVLAETLRKHPPLFLLLRQCNVETALPKTNVVVPKGIKLIIPIIGIHHDPDIYPEPDKFDPERFTEENVKARHPCAYLPFGQGPKKCIAYKFGLTQVKLAIVHILSHFKTMPGPNMQSKITYSFSPVLFPKNQLLCRFEPR